VELMGGSISVKSAVGKGTTFTLLLPVRLEAGAALLPSEFQTSRSIVPELVPDVPEGAALAANEATASPAGEKPILLLIEDNADVTTYIVGLLEKDYAVLTAPNGLAGIETAFDTIPDLIISDVMMPEKDGYEVCEILKNDERTSHIPIVLLTAKAEVSDRITGLRKGADAYLMKPFNKEELYVRLEKLLELRRALQSRYANLSKGMASSREVAEPTLEDLFLQKLQKTVLENLDDAELGAVHLSRAVHLSTSQLYRKLNALTGEPPNAFIRKIRLQRAMELLTTTDLSISEIAYDVGFNDPNYFSRAFSKEFGKTPSEYRK
jgi:YesN/AraC family two-component response regulator